MNAPSFDVGGFELRFQSLTGTACVYSFPCDAAGNVNLDTLSERERNRYLYARAVIGREFSLPQKEPVQPMPHRLKEAA